MTAKELQKRNNKAEQLRVLQTEDGQFFVESEQGKVLYGVTFTDDQTSCTCGDWAKNSKRDPNAKCKHIIAVMNSIPSGQLEAACFLDKHTPRLDERFVIKIDGHEFVKFQGLLDLGHQKGISQSEHTILDEVLPDTDVLYVTRVQKERFENPAGYDLVKDSYIITPKTMSAAKDKMIVMHPLPRVGEISMDFDDDPRAAYFRQMEFGLYVRMALLAMVLGKA